MFQFLGTSDVLQYVVSLAEPLFAMLPTLLGLALWFGSLVLMGLVIPRVAYLMFVGLYLRECDWQLHMATEDRSYWRGKVVWITGATSGIGRAAAVLLARRGAKLILSGRRVDTLEEVAQECRQLEYRCQEGSLKRTPSSPDFTNGVEVLTLPMDMTNLESIDEVAKRAMQWRQRIDVLFNNAGISQRSVFPPYSVDEEVLVTDLLAHIKVTKAILPSMLERGSGHIINTGSAQSRMVLPGRTAYSAAKHGLLAYFAALACEFEASGKDIFVTTALPGHVLTELSTRVVTNEIRKRSDYGYGHGTSSVSRPDAAAFSGMSATRCAALMLRAASNRLEEVWIAKQPELLYLYLCYGFPNLWKFCVKLKAPSLLRKTKVALTSASVMIGR